LVTVVPVSYSDLSSSARITSPLPVLVDEIKFTMVTLSISLNYSSIV